MKKYCVYLRISLNKFFLLISFGCKRINFQLFLLCLSLNNIIKILFWRGLFHSKVRSVYHSPMVNKTVKVLNISFLSFVKFRHLDRKNRNFQQKNDSTYTSNSTSQWLRSIMISILDWPPLVLIETQ